MKKSSLILMGILAFTVIATYISAQETSARKPTYVQFEEFLQGSVAQDTISYYGEWTAINDEVITGIGLGDLVGSPITFTIVSNRRLNECEEKGFTDGVWEFVSSGGSTMSGIFRGNGTKITEFSGRFVTTMSQKGTEIYYKARISGQFTCRFIKPPAYGDSWRYEAWWNGTFREGGE